MKARPIPFTDEMIRALLTGRKTMTRRVVQGVPHGVVNRITHFEGRRWNVLAAGAMPYFVKCPYGHPGDLLWCKEVYGYAQCAPPGKPSRACWAYRADRDDPKDYFGIPERRWHSPRFMPRRASRLTLQLTDVRVERVQGIDPSDIEAEGIEIEPVCCGSPVVEGDEVACCGCPEPDMGKALGRFRDLWNSLNAKRGYGWDENPWVWVLEFRTIHANVDDVLRDPAAHGLEAAA